MSEIKLVSLLGLAQKAGKTVSGDFAVDSAIRSGKAQLLIIACDTSLNTKKDLYALAARYNVAVSEVMTKDQLGNSIGKAHRASLAITDLGFSKALLAEISTLSKDSS